MRVLLLLLLVVGLKKSHAQEKKGDGNGDGEGDGEGDGNPNAGVCPGGQIWDTTASGGAACARCPAGKVAAWQATTCTWKIAGNGTAADLFVATDAFLGSDGRTVGAERAEITLQTVAAVFADGTLFTRGLGTIVRGLLAVSCKRQTKDRRGSTET